MNAPLRVCADPNDLPFSNKSEQGFENKLAEMVGHSLGKQVQFVWEMQGNGFLRSVYDRKCDVVMGLPTADHAYGMLTTEPYYRSAYALVYRANAPYQLKSLDDPRLRTLQIGVHSMSGDNVYLPPGTFLARRGMVNNVHGYDLFADYYRKANPSANLIKAVADGDVDVAIAWGPLAGYFASREPVKLTVVPLAHTHTKLPFQYPISMAVRHDDTTLRDKLNAFLATHRAKIHELLANYGVPQLDLPPSGTSKMQARVETGDAQD
ncbi:MAG TPA: quinoprotein dehydrogenase-associated putative ABC transporter substrate-binding protein [Rhodanobacteraceae bacterium]|nr:quinoprotein dehydrogenase-associated putative ABC transporter substrate-binding protein [Rhodanobacteraceae bacterium]